MATDPFDALRLTLMQDVLPVGLAVVDRARRGGAAEVMAAFDGSASDPLGRLRQEGEPAASQLRDNLDRLQPGLGNPVVKVDVRDVDAETASSTSTSTSASGSPAASPAVGAVAGSPSGAVDDDGAALAELRQTLALIEQRLSLLERRLQAAAAEPANPA
ncbi:MAG: hypothetical protein VKK97_07715 [Synechococcaceae cyanobacterium]|nr:hypothetical protein [Synechococcaceae cyanobacterium]